MEAVANPSRTRELFFVADGTGGHVFAETYEAHQRNVARWRQIEGERRDAAPPIDMPPGQRQGDASGVDAPALAPTITPGVGRPPGRAAISTRWRAPRRTR